MADVVGQLIGWEYKTVKWNKDLKQEEPCNPHDLFIIQLPDGKKKFIRKYHSEKAMPWTQKALAAQGLTAVNELRGKAVAMVEKPSTNPQYPNPQWDISLTPAAQAPPPPSAPMAPPVAPQVPPSAPVAPPAQPAPHYQQQDDIPGMQPPAAPPQGYDYPDGF